MTKRCQSDRNESNSVSYPHCAPARRRCERFTAFQTVKMMSGSRTTNLVVQELARDAEAAQQEAERTAPVKTHRRQQNSKEKWITRRIHVPIPNARTTEHDIESLLNNLMMLTTFTLGFALSVLCQFESGELKGWDEVFATDLTDWTGVPNLKPDGDWTFLASTTTLNRTITASLILFVSMMVAVSTYLGFALIRSEIREDARLLATWFGAFKHIIIFAYILYVIGTTLFFAGICGAMYGLFPKYCNVKTGGRGTKWRPADDAFEEGCANSFSEYYIGRYFKAMVGLLVGFFVFSLALTKYVRSFSRWYEVEDAAEVKAAPTH